MDSPHARARVHVLVQSVKPDAETKKKKRKNQNRNLVETGFVFVTSSSGPRSGKSRADGIGPGTDVAGSSSTAPGGGAVSGLRGAEEKNRLGR